MYIYRNAERKANNIGKTSRVLKESSIDCLLNKSQMNASDVNMDQKKKLLLSNKKHIFFNIGNKFCLRDLLESFLDKALSIFSIKFLRLK